MKTTTPILAFHSDKAVKNKYLSRIRAHRKADDLRSGFYWEEHDGRMMGCAVGCILHSNQHANAEPEMGVPPVLTRLLDRLYEALWNRDQEFAKDLPERFVNAPKPGADLSLVWPKFALWMLTDETAGVLKFAKREQTIASIKTVAALYRRWSAGDKPATSEWESARNLAWAARNDAAYAAADAAVAYAAAAADAAYAYAADAAAYAADAAAVAYAADAAYAAGAAYARKQHYIRIANKLIELMEEVCPAKK